MNFRNTILLTGAGFTANFGGFLAKEMWTKIFNYPRLNQAGKIKQDLHDKYNSFDFEKIYSDILDNTSSYDAPWEKDIFKEAVVEVYKDMNDYITRPDGEKIIFADQVRVLEFLNFFLKKDEDRIGGYFTLNQDMFPEIKYNWVPFGPAVKDVIRANVTKILPNQNKIDEFEKNIPADTEFCYAKIHGAVNWIEGSSEAMVLGINKPHLIDKIPLLKWYFHLFHEAINKDGTRLLIIGYGFRDKHINNEIYKAVMEHRLKLYVISPEHPMEFKKKLTLKGYGEPEYIGATLLDQNDEGIEIWRAVKAYFPYKLSEIFPVSGKRTAALDEILKILG